VPECDCRPRRPHKTLFIGTSYRLLLGVRLAETVREVWKASATLERLPNDGRPEWPTAENHPQASHPPLSNRLK
jgi:hypothetical protein